MKRVSILVAVMATVMAMFAQNNPVLPASISLTKTEQQLVNKNNGFAFKLFREAWQAESMMLSPLSITYALGLLNNGATGTTQQEICDVLGFGDVDATNAFCRKMLTESTVLDEQTKVMISNAIFLNEPRQIMPDFKEVAETFYDTYIDHRDFSDGETMDVINQWGRDHTEQMIPQILNEESFNPLVASYLLNAIYFKAPWTLKFDKEETKEESFGSGGQVVQMMHLKNELSYKENDICQMLTLPYGNQAYCMTVLLPREGKTMDDVLNSIDGEEWKTLITRRMSYESVDVKLPRIETTTSLDLVEIMQRLGITTAFDKLLAEFPNFYYGGSPYISNMSQASKIKLDEEGTEAAAITILEVSDGVGVPEPKTYEFHANRPFVYVISEQSTGTIFFIGQYMGEGVQAAIATPRSSGSEDAIYSLNGQRLNSTPSKGIYIRNDRKVMVGR